MRNSSSLDWLRFMHTPNDYRVSHFISPVQVTLNGLQISSLKDKMKIWSLSLRR